MANLTDTGVNGDLRVTGKIYGTVNAVNVNDANLAVPAVGTGDYVGSTGDYFVGSGSGRNLPDSTNNFNIHATVTHYTSTTYRVSQIATPTSSTQPTGIYERCGTSTTGTSWTFGSWMGTSSSSHSHGNIANGGTLTDTAAAAADNDLVVIRDADNAKIQTSTIKGTDVVDAVTKKHSHSSLTLSTTGQKYDGTNTLALPSTDPYTSARTPTSHASSATTYGVGTTANYGHVKLDNSTPLTVGTLNADGVATGKAHIHNALESVARASVTTADLEHINTNTRAHMILSQITSATSTTHDPGDGYMLSFMWDNTGKYDAQIYIPDADSSASVDYGRLKIRYANNSSWGDWKYLPLAAQSTLLTNADDLNTIKATYAGEIIGCNWSTNSVPANAPISTATSQMLVFRTHSGNYLNQLVITAGGELYVRNCNNSTWGSWNKILVSSDITTGTDNGNISVAGTDVAVKGWSTKADIASPTFTGTPKAPTAAAGTNTTQIATTAFVQTAIGSKANITRWSAVTQGQKWSRICLVEPKTTTVGNSGILWVGCTRANVVCNAAFLITASHAGKNASRIIELASCNYSKFQCRLVINSSANYYFEIYDTANSIASGTTQTWYCRYLPFVDSTITAYTAFTDGTTIPENYQECNNMEIVVGSDAAAIRNITRSGTTFTATKQDGSTFTFSQQDSNTIPSAYCETAAGTAAKSASCTNYTATANTYLHVLIRYANTSAGALTLNVNGQGAKPIYINGAVSSATNYTLPAGTYIVFYDGTNYCLRTDGRIEGKVTGTAGFADAVYNRSNNDGDGWYKIAESSLAPRTNSDVTAAWDVFRCTAGGGLYVEKLTLDVRFNESGDGVVSRFYRTYEFDSTASVKFAVLVSGQGGTGNTQVQLWAYLSKAWQSVSIHQDAGSNWSLQKYNNTWSYYSATTGGTSKPVADSTNHISVTDSTNLYTRDASMIASGKLPVSRGGTGMSTATNVNSVVIGNSTTATSAMQTVRTGNGAFYATAQDAKPQFGILPAAQGGTGKTSAKDACNAFINALDTGSSTPVDADYYVSQYVSGGTTTTTYHRRPMSALWTYINGKLTSVSGVNISGNAATASAAQSGSALENAINGKVSKSGDTMTGLLTITRADNAISISHGTANKYAGIQIQRTDTSTQMSVGISSSNGTTHGIYSNKHTKWIVCADADGLVRLNQGNSTDNVRLGNSDVGSSAQPVFIDDGQIKACTMSSLSVGSATTATNANNVKVTTKTDGQIYLAGALASGYSTGGNAALYTDTGIYATATSGQLHATTFDVNSKCTLQFNTTTNALDFVFA